MIIAKANHTGTVAHYFREAGTSVDLTPSKFRTIDDIIAKVDSGKRPVFKTNDELGTEASANTQKLHYKLYFDRFIEGSSVADFFAKKDGYFLPDFTQNGYTLESYFGADMTASLVVGGSFTYDKKAVELKMVGNILGSVNSDILPVIVGGFTSCIVRRSGVPCLYISNGDTSYYISTVEEATIDTSPWRDGTSDICCSLIHCDTALTDKEFTAVRKSFLGLTASKLFGSINFTENSGSSDLSATKVAEVNSFLSETL